jgi:putative nucleotidyltransferase with HDIG domain
VGGVKTVLIVDDNKEDLRTLKTLLESHAYKVVSESNAVEALINEREIAKQRLEEALQRTERALLATIRAIALTIEKRDPYLSGHQRRVTQLAFAIANEMGLSGNQTESIRRAGLLHDLGKIQVPVDILSKPIPLTNDELALIKTHPQTGYEILTAAEFPLPVPNVVLQHHERIDGSGYPAGLRNGQILLEARVLAVADVVEAISSNRPYRPALGMARALDEVHQNRGVTYDSDVVDACVKVVAEKEFVFKSEW